VNPSTPLDADVSVADAVSSLSVTDRVKLLSGGSMWETASLGEIAPVVLSNGPHGVGKQTAEGDHVGATATVPATCFPSATTLASTWDLDLVSEVGAAMGREARSHGVDVLLGPGMNLKRHPGGGRVFEYFSEDPLVSGKIAAALVRGVQSQGVGSSIKHFAGNNQETDRMRMDSVIDERTLRELYLRGFEIAVRESAPWTVMTSYNLLNGVHTGESDWLLNKVLREEWGFDGLVMTDWIATFDRESGIRAGLDLEMPNSSNSWDARILRALNTGTLDESEVNTAAERVVALSQRAQIAREGALDPVDLDAHHSLARRAAAAGTVLLRNDGLLPLERELRLALIGAGARTPRYQGVGSAAVNAWRVDSVEHELRERFGSDMTFAPGYDSTSGEVSAENLQEARNAATSADAVVLLLAVPAGAEAEGVDRNHLRMPDGFEVLVRDVIAANPRTVVVLVNGAPLEIPWADEPAALIEAYLGGQASGSALVDVLTGAAEPGGRLAESFPVHASDLPASSNFPTTRTQTQYRETHFVGYRFHDTFGVAPRFPFGHGLTYTDFDYGHLEALVAGDDVTVSLDVTNTGSRTGSDVVQMYVAFPSSVVSRPAQELRAFTRVRLEPGETRRVTMSLDRDALAMFDVVQQRWLVEPGRYEIRVGASSRDIRCTIEITVESQDAITPVPSPAAAVASDSEFAELLGHAVPRARGILPYTTDSTIDDLRSTWLGRRLRGVLLSVVSKQLPEGGGEELQEMLDAVVGGMPLRAMVASAGGRLSYDALDRLISVLNLTSRKARRAGAAHRREAVEAEAS
jgi:beta-glucosidase